MRIPVNPLIFALALGLCGQACAGQVLNGDFNDAALGNSNNWVDNLSSGTGTLDFISPGQTGSGNAIVLHANNAYTLTSLYQDVAISSGSFVPMLDYYYWAALGDGATATGGQLVQIKNTGN